MHSSLLYFHLPHDLKHFCLRNSDLKELQHSSTVLLKYNVLETISLLLTWRWLPGLCKRGWGTCCTWSGPRQARGLADAFLQVVGF